jgi:hypothetical protein
VNRSGCVRSLYQGVTEAPSGVAKWREAFGGASTVHGRERRILDIGLEPEGTNRAIHGLDISARRRSKLDNVATQTHYGEVPQHKDALHRAVEQATGRCRGGCTQAIGRARKARKFSCKNPSNTNDNG